MRSDYLKTVPHYLLPKNTLTTFAGFMGDVTTPKIKNSLIRYFIRRYKVNMSEALEENLAHYASFNDFFIRHLKPECRPIADADIVSPVDGYISEIGPIDTGKLLQAKGKQYSVQDLLNDPEKSVQFENGLFATLYLSPQDYHRVHMPITGTLTSMNHIPGRLFSVQPLTARVIPKLFATNERLCVFFNTSLGIMAMILVGATIVGRIGTPWSGDLKRDSKPTHFAYPPASSITLDKGEEMGYFKLGSTVILLFENNHRIQWNSHLKAGDKIRLGQPLAMTQLVKN